MPLELHPIEESDFLAYADACWAAFGNGTGGIMDVMYNKGFSEEARQYTANSGRRAWQAHPDKVLMRKVVDTDLPADDPYKKIVGFSKWKIYAEGRTAAVIQQEKAEDEADGDPPGFNGEFWPVFEASINEAKERLVGEKPFLLLHILVTLP